MQGKNYNISFIDNLTVYTTACQRIAEIQEILATVSDDVNNIINTDTFTGSAADNIKAFAREIHLPLISSVSLMLSEYQAKLMLYYSEYFGIDGDYATKFCSETMETYRNKALKYDNANNDVKQSIADSISKVSDIILLANPSMGTLGLNLQGMAGMIDKLDGEICDYEQAHAADMDSLTEFISNLEVFITYYRENVKPGQYQSGDCLNNTYAQTLRESMLVSQEYLQNNQDRLNAASEQINAIAQRMQEDYDAAVQARIDEGRAKLIMGIGVAIIGGIAIVASAGAATPAVAAAMVVTGGCTMGYGIANAEEGAQDIYYGMHGDLSSYAINPIRDTIFFGNQELYDLWGNANMLAVNVLTAGSGAYLSATEKGLQGVAFGKSIAVSVSKELLVNKMGDVATDMTVNYIDQHVNINQTERALLSVGIGALVDPGTYETVGKIGGKIKGATANKGPSMTEIAHQTLLPDNEISFVDFMSAEDAARYNKWSEPTPTATITAPTTPARNGVLTSMEAEDIAFDAIHGPKKADAIVLGKYGDGGPTAYTSVAKDMDAQFFQLDNWDELAAKYPDEEIWKINEKFLDIQTSSGREVYLSHNPYDYLTKGDFYSKELNYLLDNGYRFVNEGDVWHAIR